MPAFLGGRYDNGTGSGKDHGEERGAGTSLSPKAFLGSSVPSISHAAANDPVNHLLFFCPRVLAGLVGSRRMGGTCCCRLFWEPQQVTPGSVSSSTTPGTFQAGIWMGYGQARHDQLPASSSSSSSLTSQNYPCAAAGAWICVPLADGCQAEGGTWTFAHEGETGALSSPALMPSDSWISQVPPCPPFSYGPCSAGNGGGGVGCVRSLMLCTLITGWLFNDGSVSSPPSACGCV